MKIEPPPNKPEPAPASPKRGWRHELWFWALGILLLVILAISLLTAASNRRLIWLTPAELKAANASGLLTQLKNHVKQLAMPVWKHFSHIALVIQLDSNFLSVSEEAGRQINLGAPTSTNRNGMRAWILSPAQFAVFKSSIKTNSGVVPMNSPRIQTLEFMQSEIGMTQTVFGKLNKNEPAAVFPVGATVDVVSKVIRDSVRVTVGATATELAGHSQDGVLLIKTNFALACQVEIPSEGALVVDGGNGPVPGGTNCWLILSPTVLDAQGRPRKP